MGRIVLIILLLTGNNVVAGRHLLIINQRQELFINDANGWSSYFKQLYPGIQITRLSAYTNAEAGEIVREYGLLLKPADTLILVVSAHTHAVNQKGFSILQMDAGNNIDVQRHVIWQYTWEFWLNYLESKKIRSLFILNACHPFTLISRTAAEKVRYTTIVYSTDRDANIMYEKYGSLLLVTMKQARLSDISSYMHYCANEWRDKRYYAGTDYRDGRRLIDYYPIQPIMYGPNFYF